MSKKKTFLSQALQNRSLIRFSRRFESGKVYGYVLDIGPIFFLVAVFGDGFSFDGFQCFRQSDIRTPELASTKIAAMYDTVLKIRKSTVPAKPNIDLAQLEVLLSSANEIFPLVTIYREKISPDDCNIGRVIKVGKTKFSLLEINTDASWDKYPTRYQLSDITRVDFGGDYETGLYQAGSTPPIK